MKQRKGKRGNFLHFSVAVICFTFAAALILACLLAPVFASGDPNQIDMTAKFAMPSEAHLLGTDYLGRDMFARILWGGRNTLGYAAGVTVISAMMGTTIGMLSGCAGGWTDRAVMKGSDVIRAFPGIILVLIVVSVFGVGIQRVCLAMLLTRWIWYARVSRNLTRVELTRTSLLASRLAGSRWPGRMVRHILPAILPQMMSVLSIDFGSALLSISAYSFLGLGILPPDPEWGMMVSDGRNYMEHMEMMIWPGLCILLIVISANLLGDKLRDYWEEKRT